MDIDHVCEVFNQLFQLELFASFKYLRQKTIERIQFLFLHSQRVYRRERIGERIFWLESANFRVKTMKKEKI